MSFMKRKDVVLGLALAGALVFAGIAQADHHKPKNIVDTAKAAGNFETLLTAAKAAGLADTLAHGGPFTVFAPTDDAFAKLPKGTIPALLKNKDKLKAILTFHVVPGTVMAKDVTGLKSANTVLGQSAPVDTTDGVKIANAKVTKTNIKASNGVIHVIDSVMMPKNVVEIAAGNNTFSTLVAAVKAAGLVETLAGDGPFTILAPTNAAFAALPDGTVESLLKPENKNKLTAVLTYHVIPGRYNAADMIALSEALTVQSGTVEIDVARNKDGSVRRVNVDNAKVIQTDIAALNGVIHIVDEVLMP